MNMLMLLLFVAIWFNSLVSTGHSSQNDTLNENCSAIDAYVEIVSPDSMQETLLSAQALFPPFIYHLQSTELILLESSDNNACFDLNSNNGNVPLNDNNAPILNTNVTGKAVLIWHGNDFSDATYECSDESKVFILESNGAVAVIIANNYGNDVVETISIDYDLEIKYDYEPSIPVRMITQMDGLILQDYIESTATTSGSTSDDSLKIEISCFDNEFANTICIVDESDDLWFIDGEYQRQALITYNDHPIYMKSQYYGLLPEMYIFLEDGSYSDLSYIDANMSYGWHWVISFELNSTSIYDIVGYCTDGDSSDPSECMRWKTLNMDYYYYYYGVFEYVLNDKIIVDDSLCQLTDATEKYICVDSGNYTISGLSGTYSLLNKGSTIWTRQLNEYDMTPGVLYFNDYFSYWGYYEFLIIDTVDGNDQAFCPIDSNMNITLQLKISPQLCTSWYVVPDSTTDDSNFVYDSTFMIDSEECEDDNGGWMSSNETEYGDLCLGGITLLHGLLEGTYELLDDIRTSSGRGVWRSKHLYENSEEYNAYIWYLGDFEATAPMWIVSFLPPNKVNETTGYLQYGYCFSMTYNPADCQGCWFFYYNGDYDSDCNAYLNREECSSSTDGLTTSTELPMASDTSVSNANDNDELPNFLCLSINENDEFITYYNRGKDYFSGTYVISSLLFNDTSVYGDDYVYVDGKHYWMQVTDSQGYMLDINDSTHYFVYDSVFRFWLLGTGLDGFSHGILKCDEYKLDNNNNNNNKNNNNNWKNKKNNKKKNDDNPANCIKWRLYSSNEKVDLTISESFCQLSIANNSYYSTTLLPQPSSQDSSEETLNTNDTRFAGGTASLKKGATLIISATGVAIIIGLASTIAFCCIFSICLFAILTRKGQGNNNKVKYEKTPQAWGNEQVGMTEIENDNRNKNNNDDNNKNNEKTNMMTNDGDGHIQATQVLKVVDDDDDEDDDSSSESDDMNGAIIAGGDNTAGTGSNENDQEDGDVARPMMTQTTKDGEHSHQWDTFN